MIDLSKKHGNPTYGLEQHYKELMEYTNISMLKTRVMEIVEPYRNHGMSRENYLKFKMDLEKCENVERAQLYLTNYICKGSGLGVI